MLADMEGLEAGPADRTPHRVVDEAECSRLSLPGDSQWRIFAASMERRSVAPGSPWNSFSGSSVERPGDSRAPLQTRCGCPISGSTVAWWTSTARGARVRGRRRGPRPQPNRGPGDEHRHPGRLQPGMEARAGRRGQASPNACSTPTKRNVCRSPAGCSPRRTRTPGCCSLKPHHAVCARARPDPCLRPESCRPALLELFINYRSSSLSRRTAVRAPVS